MTHHGCGESARHRSRPVQVRVPRSGGCLRVQVPEGPGPRDRGDDLAHEERARLDAGATGSTRSGCGRRSRSRPGAATWARSISTTSTTTSGRWRIKGRPGTTCRREHQADLRPAGDPRGGEEVPGRRGRAVRERGRLPQPARGVDEAGRGLPRHGLRAARTSGHRQGVLRDGHPARGQQVRGAQQRGVERRVVRLRSGGRARRRFRCRRTSGSTRRTWASSSGR